MTGRMSDDTPGDLFAKEQIEAALNGCCANDSWRGRFCEYHQGLADGYDAAHDFT